MAHDLIMERKRTTDTLLERIRREFLEDIGDAYTWILDSQTTIYVAGSGGRGDMGTNSDLDPYVVCLEEAEFRTGLPNAGDRIRSALISALERVGSPELDAGGEYARLVTAASLFEHFGDQYDDANDSLTRRMLLLLESRPLVNEQAHELLVNRAIDAYWKNESRHRHDYLPIVLVNDIVRYWRILLLNHESRILEKSRKKNLTVDEQMAIRRYSSYKLRIPRCLTCFSALAHLLSLTPEEPANVSREDIVLMTKMAPIDRLESLRGKMGVSDETIDALRLLYCRFLETTGIGKDALISRLITDGSLVDSISRDGNEFTRHTFGLIQSLGGGRTLHRAIVV